MELLVSYLHFSLIKITVTDKKIKKKLKIYNIYMGSALLVLLIPAFPFTVLVTFTPQLSMLFLSTSFLDFISRLPHSSTSPLHFFIQDQVHLFLYETRLYVEICSFT